MHGEGCRLVEEVDVDEIGIVVLDELDLSKPLSRGRMLQLKNKSIWVTFQYEKCHSSVINAG
jgi:hypothetical protein